MANIWPIGGGKGGSGKSFLVGNLGFWLAKQGKRTLLIDADFGAANLHTMIGMPYQERSLSDFLNKKVATLNETVVETRFPNLFLISGARNNLDLANMPYEQKMKVFRAISKLSYDFVLLDLGAGTSFNTIDSFIVSDSGIFVTTPEPTSIENVYRLIRSVYARKIRHVLKTYLYRTLAEATEARAKGGMVNSPEYLLYTIRELAPEKAKIVEEALRSFQLKLILNQYRKQDNPKTGHLICRIIEKHLGLSMQFIGNIAYDELVHDAVCLRIPFLEKYPYTQTAADLKRFCQFILTARSPDGAAPQEEILDKAVGMEEINRE